jgi:hypothetical protein
MFLMKTKLTKFFTTLLLTFFTFSITAYSYTTKVKFNPPDQTQDKKEIGIEHDSELENRSTQILVFLTEKKILYCT